MDFGFLWWFFLYFLNQRKFLAFFTVSSCSHPRWAGYPAPLYDVWGLCCPFSPTNSRPLDGWCWVWFIFGSFTAPWITLCGYWDLTVTEGEWVLCQLQSSIIRYQLQSSRWPPLHTVLSSFCTRWLPDCLNFPRTPRVVSFNWLDELSAHGQSLVQLYVITVVEMVLFT